MTTKTKTTKKFTIEANTEDEAIALYNRGHYPDSSIDQDDMFYDFEFVDIKEAVQ